jgi:pre-mRNA-splicing factor CDC5/CEF1
MIRNALLSLLEHVSARYPLDEKLEKEKKKGNKCGKSAQVPIIKEFDEGELKDVILKKIGSGRMWQGLASI